MSEPTENPKTDRELLMLIYERQKVMFHTLFEVKDEVKKTNGRVTLLELWKAKLGGVWVAIILFSTIISAAMTVLINYFKP